MSAGEPSLSSLEVMTDLVFGEARDPLVLPAEPPEARAALEAAVLRGLERPPCAVSFSGGRDSSAVLALAVHVARREGLELPVPVTLRFPGVASVDESGWQEHVVEQLGLREWCALKFSDELDWVGPIAQDVLRSHGLLVPANVYFHVPVLEQARGGSVLTGVDGDGLFESWRWARLAEVARRSVRPRVADLRLAAHAFAPASVRRAGGRHRAPALGWLTAEGRRALADAYAAEHVSEPRTWPAYVEWYAARREQALWRSGIGAVAAGYDVAIHHPLGDPAFLAAIARRPPASREQHMTWLFGDLLDEVALTRRDKVEFTDVFWTEHARELARRWDGAGADRALVDVEAVRREWLSERPDARSALLLQRAWLASVEQGAERGDDRVER